MSIYRAQISFPFDSALPRDLVTINPHFNGNAAQPLADVLKSNLIAHASVGASTPFTVKIYDAKQAPPSYPLAQSTNGTGYLTTTHAREMALCLSYYAQWNRPTFRGRLFIPGQFVGGTFSLRPTSAQMAEVVSWKAVFTTGLPSGTFWTVYSRKTGLDAKVTNVWCDDEWDVMRSRGLKGTTRTVDVVP